MVSRLLSTVKNTFKNQSGLLLKPFGLDSLDKARTQHLLQPYQIYRNDGSTLTLPEVRDPAGTNKPVFAQTTIQTAPAYVWQYDNAARSARQLRSGGLVMGRQVPDTDFGTGALIKDVLKRDRRAPYPTRTLIAPWSHYWFAYYDYLLFIAAKLCRIRAVLPDDQFTGATIAYPLTQTPFERDLLNLIGCRPEQVLDSRHTAVRFETAVLGNNASWFYPNDTDLRNLKIRIEAGVPVTDDQPTGQRIYIQRTGRRRILNEDALLTMLERYGFVIAPDVPRSVAEQVRLYRSASFIIGPHGASFANVLWCRPGTQLFELFAPDYMPEYFRYMATVLNLRYTGYYEGPKPNGSDYSHVADDIIVSVDAVERALVQILKNI